MLLTSLNNCSLYSNKSERIGAPKTAKATRARTTMVLAKSLRRSFIPITSLNLIRGHTRVLFPMRLLMRPSHSSSSIVLSQIQNSVKRKIGV